VPTITEVIEVTGWLFSKTSPSPLEGEGRGEG